MISYTSPHEKEITSLRQNVGRCQMDGPVAANTLGLEARGGCCDAGTAAKLCRAGREGTSR